VTLNHFGANTRYTMNFYCNGGKLTSESITTNGSGYAHYRGAPNGLHAYCGYKGAYVTAGGVQSSVQDWSP